jgi:Flp pilus assembly protein TadD
VTAVASVERGLIEKAKSAAVLVSLILCACATSAASDGDEPPAAAAMSPLGAYLAALHAQDTRDYRSAADYIGRALATDPANLELMRRAFVLRLDEGDIAGALPLATKLADLDRSSGLAQLVLALQSIGAGRYAEAEKRAKALPSDGPERLATPLLAAWAEVGEKRADAALQSLSAAADNKLVPELMLLHRALVADYADRVDDAALAYGALTMPGAHLTWRTVELAGNFYERHQRGPEARKLYERLEDEPDNASIVAAAIARVDSGTIPARVILSPKDGAAEALFDLASVLNQRDTLDIAMIYGRLAADLRPDLAIARLLLAEIADEEGRQEAALALYHGIDGSSPLASPARLREAAMLDQLGRIDEAAALLRKLAADQPKQAEALIALGDMLREHDRFGEAVTVYDEALARVGAARAGDWRLYYSRGVALERSKQWPRAEADLRHALELQPEQPLVLNYLGYSWIDQGVHLDEALKMVERAVTLRPSDGYIIDSLGWAYYRLGNYAKATENLERAIELVPEDPTINDHLGDAYWRTGRQLEARFQWRRALQFKPDADEAAKIADKLEHGLAKISALPGAKGT